MGKRTVCLEGYLVGWLVFIVFVWGVSHSELVCMERGTTGYSYKALLQPISPPSFLSHARESLPCTITREGEEKDK